MRILELCEVLDGMLRVCSISKTLLDYSGEKREFSEQELNDLFNDSCKIVELRCNLRELISGLRVYGMFTEKKEQILKND